MNFNHSIDVEAAIELLRKFAHKVNIAIGDSYYVPESEIVSIKFAAAGALEATKNIAPTSEAAAETITPSLTVELFETMRMHDNYGAGEDRTGTWHKVLLTNEAKRPARASWLDSTGQIELYESRSLEDAKRFAERLEAVICRAAQPAADPAPVPAQTGAVVPTYPHPKCDSGCYYACTEAGTIMPPKCVTETAQGIDHADLEVDDRPEFEAAMKVRFGDDETFERNQHDCYVNRSWHDAWIGWQARGQQAGGAEDGFILKTAVDALTAHFDEFIGECMAGAPSPKAIARARACLPAKCSNAFRRESQ